MSRGFTLAELLVVIGVLGLLASVVTVGAWSLRPSQSAEVVASLRRARAEAVRSARAVAWRADSTRMLFFPDGSSSGGRLARDSIEVLVDPLSGAAHAER